MLRACMNIVAIDDKIALEGNFVANGTITVISPDIDSPPIFTSITVIDDDGEFYF